MNFYNVAGTRTVYSIIVFCSSTKWDIIKRHVPELCLKPLSDARWSSRIDAMKLLKIHQPQICDSQLHTVTIDIKVCQNYLRNLAGHFKNHRNDHFFKQILGQAEKIAVALR